MKSTTRIKTHISAPCAKVYQALLNAEFIEKWKAPDGMTCKIHEFESCEGGKFRISISSSAQARTYFGYFKTLVPNKQVIEVMQFETTDPLMKGEMISTITLTEKNGGTDILAVHTHLPKGILPSDNEKGWRTALSKLAKLVELPRKSKKTTEPNVSDYSIPKRRVPRVETNPIALVRPQMSDGDLTFGHSTIESLVHSPIGS